MTVSPTASPARQLRDGARERDVVDAERRCKVVGLGGGLAVEEEGVDRGGLEASRGGLMGAQSEVIMAI